MPLLGPRGAESSRCSCALGPMGLGASAQARAHVAVVARRLGPNLAALYPERCARTQSNKQGQRCTLCASWTPPLPREARPHLPHTTNRRCPMSAHLDGWGPREPGEADDATMKMMHLQPPPIRARIGTGSTPNRGANKAPAIPGVMTGASIERLGKAWLACSSPQSRPAWRMRLPDQVAEQLLATLPYRVPRRLASSEAIQHCRKQLPRSFQKLPRSRATIAPKLSKSCPRSRDSANFRRLKPMLLSEFCKVSLVFGHVLGSPDAPHICLSGENK